MSHLARFTVIIMSGCITAIGLGVMATYVGGNYEATAITGHTPIASGTGFTFVLVGINQLIISVLLTHLYAIIGHKDKIKKH